mgnify:CR=1 FL=1
MVFVGNINQSVDVLLKASSLFAPFPPEMGTDTAFLERMHCYIPGWKYLNLGHITLQMIMVLLVTILLSLLENFVKNSTEMPLISISILART